jgi:hypothetical protein
MAKIKEFTAEYSQSLQLKDSWYRVGAKITLEMEPNDDVATMKQRAWNTVEVEVERQFKEIIDSLNK